MGRSTLIVMICLFTLSCGRGSRAHAFTPDASALQSAQVARDARETGDGRDRAAAAAKSGGDAGAKVTCTPDPSFPGVFDVPEGSAAAEVELRPGVRELLVVADSGHHGAAIARVISGGKRGALRSLTLPLDKRVSDDVEGIAWRGGHLYAVISVGVIERFTPDGAGGLRRDGDAYPVGPEPYVCRAVDLDDGNCGMNYEGLCLRPETSLERCAGYIASKKEGWLGCMIFQGDKLVLDRIKPKLALGLPKHALSDCAFGAAGGPAESTLLVTTNIFGGSTTYVVHEGTGALTALDITGTPTNEAIAVDHEGLLVQVMDDNGNESPVLAAKCSGW